MNRNDFFDLLVIIFGAIFGISLMFIVLGGIAYVGGRSECSAKAKMLNFEYEYGLFKACWITVNGEKLLLETYLNRKVEQNVKVREEK